ncbi:MAG TPA: 4-alpha-glucanotransferase [Bdellovibrionales bacterium]|nr:MAG: hypothetical protein A2Z97_15000 [Bdellovibrionales bacterium GWB1_52_6]OFZ03269.1 MAG: hypothetical protein A2X97_10115 [Bdellovibrionales bacterium GWA1_52_35]OFZ39174.1 MAG: hypothetical protein A2070_01325 [Bdellovibrionales bacterium GWC1_52_8]HAR44023.1 4-alpha-glucanotransferase [Bdellovibrionales bacterium]HCM40545.1 4-alpha-glucanotransferase [Bdellovibrionales bacterium]
MRILMLGWEYPPHISGGLGTACEGLTRALARQGVEIDFVVPHLFGGENAPHMKLMDSTRFAPPVTAMGSSEPRYEEQYQQPVPGAHAESILEELFIPGEVSPERAAERKEKAAAALGGEKGLIRTIRIPSYLSPYMKGLPTRKVKKKRTLPGGTTVEEEIEEFDLETGQSQTQGIILRTLKHAEDLLPAGIRALLPHSLSDDSQGGHYTGDLFSEVGQFTARVLALAKERKYDMIHAHDWMTFPAGVALKALTGLPLVIHVHSLEYDRSGENGNRQIEEVEKIGLDGADTVIAVSHYTRGLINQRHGTSLDKIAVVHNGVYSKGAIDQYRQERNWPSKIVLFLGRVTFQKGPDYFVDAAARVIPHIPDVLFVMAGSGDMLPKMVERVNELGIGSNFLFTGFLKGQEVEKMFSMADLYVMPSVSEPFGISALEAISFNAPVIISRQSGVSEVLSHALKVNFWDVEQLANLVISVLKYPELRQDISVMAGEEVRRLRWDASAVKTAAIYSKTLARFARR